MGDHASSDTVGIILEILSVKRRSRVAACLIERTMVRVFGNEPAGGIGCYQFCIRLFSIKKSMSCFYPVW